MAKAILIVDDEVDMLKLLKLFLAPYGYKIYLAPNGREAIELSKKYNFALTLMDLKMPGVSGWETIKQIIKDKPASEFLIMVGCSIDPKLLKKWVKNIKDICYKPFDLQELLTKIRRNLKYDK